MISVPPGTRVVVARPGSSRGRPAGPSPSLVPTGAPDLTVRVSATDALGQTAGDDFVIRTPVIADLDPGQGSHALAAGTVSDAIRQPGQRDWFQVALSAYQDYAFDLSANRTSPGALADPRLRLCDGTGREIAGTRGGGDEPDARPAFTPTRSGVYFLLAESASHGAGAFGLAMMGA